MRALCLLMVSVVAASLNACSDAGSSSTGDGGGTDADSGGTVGDGPALDAPDSGPSTDAADGSGTPDAPPPDGTGGSCPLDATARSLVEEVLHKYISDISHTALFTHGADRGFSFHLVGADVYNIGFLTTLGPCTEAVTFDPYCETEDPGVENPFFKDHNRCSRLRCEGAGVGLTDMYFTQKPETSADAPHAFTYATTSPAGMGVYDPNPFITFRSDQTDPQVIVTTADLDVGLIIMPDGEPEVDLTHTGTLRAEGPGNKDLTSVTADLSFPALAGSEPVEVSVELDAEAHGTGSIVQGDRTLATISGPFALDMPLVAEWQDRCGP